MSSINSKTLQLARTAKILNKDDLQYDPLSSPDLSFFDATIQDYTKSIGILQEAIEAIPPPGVPGPHTHPQSDIIDLVSDLSTLAGSITGKEDVSNKGAVSGYCPLDGSQKVPIANIPTGNTNITVCIGDDTRLSDARTPTAHATSHKSGGSDAIKLDELAAPTDVTTLDATITAHGLLKKLSNVSTEFLNGLGNWATPAGGSGLTHPQVMARTC